MENGNVYKSPEADLTEKKSNSGVLGNFKRFTTWGVFGLTLITYGIYPIYWLYTRSKVLNESIENKMSNGLLASFIVICVGSLLFGLVALFVTNDIVAIVNGVLSIGYLILYLMVLFKFRSRFSAATSVKLSGIITFLLSVIYLQYKINQAIDRE